MNLIFAYQRNVTFLFSPPYHVPRMTATFFSMLTATATSEFSPCSSHFSFTYKPHAIRISVRNVVRIKRSRSELRVTMRKKDGSGWPGSWPVRLIRGSELTCEHALMIVKSGSKSAISAALSGRMNMLVTKCCCQASSCTNRTFFCEASDAPAVWE